jgi:hypothetical protein
MTAIVPLRCFIARRALGWSVRHLARAAEVTRESRFPVPANEVEALLGATADAWEEIENAGRGRSLAIDGDQLD